MKPTQLLLLVKFSKIDLRLSWVKNFYSIELSVIHWFHSLTFIPKKYAQEKVGFSEFNLDIEANLKIFHSFFPNLL